MQSLLDTHVFLWWQSSVGRLSEDARSVIADPSNAIYVSAASIWEIAVKRRLGKLAYDGSAAQAIHANGFIEAPVLVADAELAGDLDWDHSDPFDRLLVAQAKSRGFTLITADTAIRRYPGVAQLAAG